MVLLAVLGTCVAVAVAAEVVLEVAERARVNRLHKRLHDLRRAAR